MPQPTPYNRAYNFTNYQTVHPSDPLPADKVDIEFNGVKITLDEVLDNLALLQADDGTLAAGVVTKKSLAADVTFGMTFEGIWTSGTAYEAGEGVSYGVKFYICQTDHTAGTSTRPDVDSATWLLAADFSSLASISANLMTIVNFTGDGTTTTFGLGVDPGSAKNVFVTMGGVLVPTGDFSVSGTSLIMDFAPDNGIELEARIFSSASVVGAVSAASVAVSPSVVGGSNVQQVVTTLASQVSAVSATASTAASSAATAQTTANTAISNAATALSAANNSAVGTSRLGAGAVTSEKLNSSAYASQAEAEAGAENTKLMTPLRVKQAITAQVSTTYAGGRLLSETYYTSSGTWTKSTNNPAFIVVEVLGGGGGGGGTSTSNSSIETNGTAGGSSSFGAHVEAGGGGGGTTKKAPSSNTTTYASGGVGGAVTVAGDFGVAGAEGNDGETNLSYEMSGAGAASLFGGAGRAKSNGAGVAASAPGAGGGGASQKSAYNSAGGGGGAGAYARKKILAASLGATETITVGAAGVGGYTSTSSIAGGNGGTGLVIVREYS